MSEADPSMETRILAAVKRTLTNVIRDTATPPNLRHPLSAETVEDLRQCLALISARERELAQVPSSARPQFVDEQGAGPKVVHFHRDGRADDTD